MDFTDLPVDKKIILFDGQCNLCTTSVQFVIKRDKQDLYRFVSLQSDLGQTILTYLNRKGSAFDSIVLYEAQETFYLKSAAALRILIGLGGFYTLARLFLVFPQRFNDLLYDFVARNRYHWYGKRETCMVPTPDLASKFLS